MGLLLVGRPAYAQEQDFFSLLDEDRRREFTLELGPSFMDDPVFRGFEDASGIIHPATKINLKTPRHISGTFGWRLNDWLRVQASINFNAADFSGASSADAVQEEVFNQAIIERIRNQTNDGQSDLRVNGICQNIRFMDDITVSVYCLVSNRVYNRLRADRERAFIMESQEYTDEFAPNDMNDPCDVACALIRAETAIRADEDRLELLTNANTGTAEEAQQEAEQVAAAAEFSVDRQTYAAEGTFFSIGSFLSAYADIPLTSGIWLYGGGGAGISWSHVKEGFYTRDTSFNLTNADDIESGIETRLSFSDDFDATLGSLESSRSQRTDIISTITSFAMTGAVGFRTVVFEGLVVDSGYQVIWTQKGFYRGSDEKIAHLVRVGFIFNF